MAIKNTLANKDFMENIFCLKVDVWRIHFAFTVKAKW